MSGEQLLWEGKPFEGFVVTSMDAFLIPFSLLWASFAVFWNVSVWASGAPVFFSLFGLPFLIVGAYFVIGRFLHDRFIRRGTSYRVSNRRILIERNGKQKSLDIRRLPQIELNETQDGSGSIRFGSSLSIFAMNGFAIWSPSFDPTPQFIRIPNARGVYEIIQRAADSQP
jgi:hypothetical protein